MLDTTGRNRRNPAFGRAVENAGSDLAERNALLWSTGLARDAAGRFTSTTDFKGIGPWASNLFEVTTESHLESQLLRSYGTQVFGTKWE
jgi:hypothetical protein